MLFSLLSHQLKSFIRSRNAGKNIAVQIFIGLIVLYFLVIAIVLGYSIGSILHKAFPNQNTIKIFCGFILYYFLFDIIMRFMLQDLPVLAVQPYLLQNIKKSTLIKFLNIRSLFSFFNILPLFLFIPFSCTEIFRQYGLFITTVFIVSILALTVANNFWGLFIKRKTIINSWWIAGFFAFLVILIGCDYFNYFSVQNISAVIFYSLLQHSWIAVFIILWAIISYYNNYSFLKNSLYLEDTATTSSQKNFTAGNYTWLQQFGITGELIIIDMKMILRNKRPRSLFLLSIIFLLYGFIFYKQQYLEKNELGFILLGAFFITGIFMANFGQYFLAWQSSHFDETMTNGINIKTYFKSKFILMISVSTVALLISLLYGIINWKIIPIEIAGYLFNIGIQPVIIGFFATQNYKGLDISQGASFNYQGVGATQWLYLLAVMLVGFIIYFPFAVLINSWAGIVAMGIISFICFLLQDRWLNIITKKFEKNKYKILEGFREK